MFTLPGPGTGRDDGPGSNQGLGAGDYTVHATRAWVQQKVNAEAQMRAAAIAANLAAINAVEMRINAAWAAKVAEAALVYPKIGENGNWWRWNVEDEDWEDTGRAARGEKGDTGEAGAKGDKGEKGDSGAAAIRAALASIDETQASLISLKNHYNALLAVLKGLE